MDRRQVHDVEAEAGDLGQALGAVGERVAVVAFWLVGTVVVHPRVYPLITASGAVRVITNDAVLRRPSGDPQSGFQSLREYQYGDDTRLIHWPTSARATSPPMLWHTRTGGKPVARHTWRMASSTSGT